MAVVRAIFELPDDLLEAIDQTVRAGKVASRNELVITALRNELATVALNGHMATMGGEVIAPNRHLAVLERAVITLRNELEIIASWRDPVRLERVVTALSDELQALAMRHRQAAAERATTDAVFAEMARDWAYQKRARDLNDQFTTADWQAFQLAEQPQ